MLTKEQNERLCRVGPGTPMGALFRRFWLPISTADKLIEPGGAPRAVRLLGQDLVVFRGRNGKVRRYLTSSVSTAAHRSPWGALRNAGCVASTTGGVSARTAKCSTS